MGIFISKEERESLKRDLVNPVKSFLDEVHKDTIVDAGKFYSARARKAGQAVKSAREKTAIRAAALKREQERLKIQRRRKIKRAAIMVAVVALVCLVVFSAILTRSV